MPRHKEPCFHVAASAAIQPEASPPVVDGQRVRLTLDGQPVPDQVLDGSISAISYRLSLDPRLFGHSPRPAPSMRVAMQGEVAGIVLRHMLVCQAVADGLRPDRPAAEAGARQQLATYASQPQSSAGTPAVVAPRSGLPGGASGLPEPAPAASGATAAPTQAPQPSRRALVQFSPVPVQTGGMPGLPSVSPRPVVPPGMTAEEYFLSEAYIDVLEESSLRLREQSRVEQAAPGMSPGRALGEWMRRHLPEYDVEVDGLGTFSLPDAYETLQAFITGG